MFTNRLKALIERMPKFSGHSEHGNARLRYWKRRTLAVKFGLHFRPLFSSPDFSFEPVIRRRIFHYKSNLAPKAYYNYFVIR